MSTRQGFLGIGSRYDAVVVGARCAGAATAMLLARRGLRVLAVDRGGYATDTLSTHALMRAGVLQLARWGVLDLIAAVGTPPVRRTVFHYEDEAVDIPIKPRDGIPALFAPRRTVLDRALVDAATEAGADVVHHVRLRDLNRTASGRIDGAVLQDVDGRVRTVRAGLLIGADGLRSSVAALVDAPTTRLGRHAAATVYGYWSGVEANGYHWHWRPGAAAGAIPTNGGEVLLFASASPERFAREVRSDIARGYRRLLEEAAPELVGPLTRARLVGPLRGFAGHPGHLRRPWGPGWALVGDAGYFKDPITAHGISDALRDVELLVRAVVEGGEAAMAGYEAARDALSERLFDVTDAIASFEWDTPELKRLHLALSEEMKREVAALLRLDAEAAEPAARVQSASA